jgi:hypothetical protein
LFTTWSGDPAVIVASPPGAGKTRLVVQLAEQLHRRAGLKITIAAQTRSRSAPSGASSSASVSRDAVSRYEDNVRHERPSNE